MTGVFRIFFGAPGTKPFFVITCLVLAGFAEAVGLMTFLPAVTQLTGGVRENSSPLNDNVTSAFHALGITPNIENLLILVIAGLVIKAILSFAALSYVGYAIAKVATGLRTQIIDRLMSARWAYFVDQKVGRIANVISNDATRAGDAYYTAAKFISYIIQGTVYAAVALAVSWQLAVIGLVIGAVMTLTLNILVRISRRAGAKQTSRTSDLVTYLSDTLANIKPIKAMERKQPFANMFAKKIKALRRSLFHQVIAFQGRIYAEEIILALCMGGGVYFAAIYWKIPVPELVVMGVIFYQVINIIGKVQKFLQSAAQYESAYWAAHRLIDEAAGEVETAGGSKTPSFKKGCRLKDITFSYIEGEPVLRDLSLDIPAGGITVLRGTSGMGKTTLIDLVIGLHKPDQGQVLIDDVPLADIDIARWRKMIGYVPQEPTLFHDTIHANITLGDETLGEKDVWRALEAAGALNFAKSLKDGLDTIVGERGARFSGGQRQRIALARALVTKPKLLILDEVTSALDPQTEREICENIAGLTRAFTILAITHRPIWAEYATTLYEIEHGAAKRERARAKPAKPKPGKRARPKTRRARKVSL